MKVNTELLTDYLNNRCNDQSKKEIEKWIEENPENRAYFEELKLYWESQSTEHENIKFDTEKAFIRLNTKKFALKQFRKRKILRYAALIALLVSSNILLFYFISNKSDQEFVSNKSDLIIVENHNVQEKVLNLPDGSSILLAQGGSITYSEKFSDTERFIQLRGEAFFNIAKDKNRPFIINTSRTRTQVLGTSFLISENISNTSIEVKSGIVEFMEIDEPTNIVRLVKGDRAKFVNKQRTVLKGKQELSDAEFRIQHLAYQNQKLALICNDLNELFNTDIRLEGDNTPMLTLTAIYEDQNLDNILETISFSLDLDIEKQNNYILLK